MPEKISGQRAPLPRRGLPTGRGDTAALPAGPRLGLDIRALRPALLAWYRAHRRDLPWRRSRDPYRIWIAEIMLQQTRASTVRRHYERFLRRFPDIETLARTRPESVLHAWSGLGYYARARNLHAAAHRIVQRHGGRFPAAEGDVRALPGIGPYTAGAILSIAFGRPAAILDGNVARVLGRLLALEDVESAPGRRQLWEVAGRWAAGRTPGEANQALMELGATVCVKPVPDCAHCPLERACAARRRGLERRLPRPRRRATPRVVPLAAALLQRGGRLLLVRRRGGTLLRGWWEIPACRAAEDAGGERRQERSTAACGRLERRLRSRLGIRARDLQFAGRLVHGILQNRLEVQLWAGPAASPAAGGRSVSVRSAPGALRQAPRPARPAAAPLANLDLDDLEVRWASPSQCRTLPLATLTRKALRAAAAGDSCWSEYADGQPAEESGRQRHHDPSR